MLIGHHTCYGEEPAMPLNIRHGRLFSLLLSPVEAENYKMGSDEDIRAAHQEYLDRERREFDSLPSPILKRKEVK